MPHAEFNDGPLRLNTRTASRLITVRRHYTRLVKDPTHRYRFYRGDTLLGTVVHTEDDQPFHIGYIEPAPGFQEVASLFEEMATAGRASDAPEERARSRDRFIQLRDEIARPGLRMVGESTGQIRFEPQLFNTDGTKFWWRGYVWHEGQRL